MKVNCVHAETSSHESGSIEIKHVYEMDALADFEKFVEGLSEDEAIEAGQDRTYIEINSLDIEHELHKLMDHSENVEFSFGDMDISYVGYGLPETIEQCRESAKNLKFEVSTTVSFRLTAEAQTSLEASLLKAVNLNIPKAKQVPEGRGKS